MPKADQPRSLPGGIASIADALVGYEINMDDYDDDDEEGGVRLDMDDDTDAAERDVGHEEQIKSVLD